MSEYNMLDNTWEYNQWVHQYDPIHNLTKEKIDRELMWDKRYIELFLCLCSDIFSKDFDVSILSWLDFHDKRNVTKQDLFAILELNDINISSFLREKNGMFFLDLCSKISEKISSILSNNNRDYWNSTFRWKKPEYYYAFIRNTAREFGKEMSKKKLYADW